MRDESSTGESLIMMCKLAAGTCQHADTIIYFHQSSKRLAHASGLAAIKHGLIHPSPV